MDESGPESKAAQVLQRRWRGRQNANSPSTPHEGQNGDLRDDGLWNDAVSHAKLQTARNAADSGQNSAKARWKRAGLMAARLQVESGLQNRTDRSTKSSSPEMQKHLETQHWLELVDGKHRYGSNLKYYHRRWQDSDTSQNFFYWLDRGEGKDLSLDECSRERLEQEVLAKLREFGKLTIALSSYLSPRQRLNYLVIIDEKGLLRWKKNNDLVDTTAGRWKDDGKGGGVVPMADEDPDPAEPQRRTSFDSSPSISAGSSLQSNEATHYVEDPRDKSRNVVVRYLRGHFTARGIVNRLLRKTVRRNTWIYVSDKNYDLYVGIKKTGVFQHSSLLGGGIVTSAGLISVKEGRIYTLSPLSGHYRTSIDHFNRFTKELKKKGVDMHKAKISKAKLALWSVEHMKKFEKKKAQHVKAAKATLTGGSTHAHEEESKGQGEEDPEGQKGSNHKPETPWRREILEGRKKPSESDSKRKITPQEEPRDENTDDKPSSPEDVKQSSRPESESKTIPQEDGPQDQCANDKPESPHSESGEKNAEGQPDRNDKQISTENGKKTS